MAANTATGQMRCACRMNHISGSVSSWLVSLTMISASALGSSPSVADRCGCPWPPTPGVSMNVSPPCSSGLGAAISTRSTSRLPACGARRRSVLMSSIGMSTGVDSPLGPAATISRADGGSPWLTTVMTTVASSSPTRATGRLSNELSSWLLPCLSWPAITTRIRGSVMRSRARASRCTRLLRSLSSAMARVWSISSTITLTRVGSLA